MSRSPFNSEYAISFLIFLALQFAHATSLDQRLTCLAAITSEKTLELHDLKLDDTGVYWRGQTVVKYAPGILPGRPWALLRELADRPGESLRRADLIARLWPEHAELSESQKELVLANALKIIRASFRAVDPSFDWLQSIRGGYIRWRLSGTPATLLEAGSLVITDRAVFWRGVQLPSLTGHSFVASEARHLLLILARAPDLVFSFRALRPSMPPDPEKPGSPVSMNTLRSYLARVRRAFREADPEFNQLLYRPRLGYVWTAPVPTFVALGDGLAYSEVLDAYRYFGKPVEIRASGKVLLRALLADRPGYVPSDKLRLLLEDSDYSANKKKVSSLLRVQMLHLRRAFTDVDPEFRAIEGHRKFGYRWKP